MGARGLRAVAFACAGAVAAHAAPAQDAFQRPGLRTFRYDEDYSFLADPGRRERWFDPIKYIALSDTDPEKFLSIGGELRLRGESYRPPDLGLSAVERNDYLLTRAELHAELHWTRSARVFVEGISGASSGEEISASASQANELDLQQAFAEFSFDSADGGRSSLRAGRMEMGFGSYRLVAPRDGTNVRLNYDGLRLRFQGDSNSLEAFVTRPVEQEVGAFDDSADPGRLFFGIYGTIPVRPREELAVDLYYFGLRREDAEFGALTGTEERHSVGTRVWGSRGSWDFDTEAVGQFGDFDGQEIRAWTVASNTGYRFGRGATAPRLGLKLDVASGDRDPGDSTLGTFNALFPRNNYFSEAVLFAPANFFDAQPVFQFSCSDAIRASLAADAYFRLSEEDDVYAPGRVAIPAGASDRRYVGTTGSVQLDWTVVPNVSFTAAYVHFWAEDVVRDADGDDVDFAMLSLAFRF